MPADLKTEYSTDDLRFVVPEYSSFFGEPEKRFFYRFCHASEKKVNAANMTAFTQLRYFSEILHVSQRAYFHGCI
jgi:hypothetical protein